jgi:iron complex transport system substrate-binding protein
MRIVSLLPGATEIVAALGLADSLVGISHECDYPAAVYGKPVLVRPRIESDHVSSRQIDLQVQTAVRDQQALYLLDEESFQAARPDLVITQDLCDACAITPGSLHTALRALARPAAVLSLQPTNLEDALLDIERIGRAVGRPTEAGQLIAGLRRRLSVLSDYLVDRKSRPRVVCLDWLDPPYLAGHWVPDMIAAAGGIDALGRSGTASRPLTWAELAAAAPEILILAPCGFSAQRTIRELKALPLPQEWSGLPSVMASRVFAVDAAAHFSRPGPRLVDGIERLATVLHPDLGPIFFPAFPRIPLALPPGVECV